MYCSDIEVLLSSVSRLNKTNQSVMWPVILNFLRVNAPYVTLPFAMVVGFIGYNVESVFRKETPWKEKTIQEERDERKLEEGELEDATQVKSLKIGIPKTILDRNDKPSK